MTESRLYRSEGRGRGLSILSWHHSGRAWSRALKDGTHCSLFVSGVGIFSLALLEPVFWSRKFDIWFLAGLGEERTLACLLVLSPLMPLVVGKLLSIWGDPRARSLWVWLLSCLPLFGALVLAISASRSPGMSNRGNRSARTESPSWLMGARAGVVILALAVLQALQVVALVQAIVQRIQLDTRWELWGLVLAIGLHGIIFLSMHLAAEHRWRSGQAMAVHRWSRTLLPWLAWLPFPLLIVVPVFWWWQQDWAKEGALVATCYRSRWNQPRIGRLQTTQQPPSHYFREVRFELFASFRLITAVAEVFVLSELLLETRDSIRFGLDWGFRISLGLVLVGLVVGFLLALPWRIGRIARWLAASQAAFSSAIFLAGQALSRPERDVLLSGIRILFLVSILQLAGTLYWVVTGQSRRTLDSRGLIFMMLGSLQIGAAMTMGWSGSAPLVLDGFRALGWLSLIVFPIWAMESRRNGNPHWGLGLPGSFLFLPWWIARERPGR